MNVLGPDLTELKAYYGLFNRVGDLTSAIRQVDPNARGGGWQAASGLDFIDNPLIAHDIVAQSGIDAQGVVLDVGAGLGGASRLYASTGARVVAVDLLSDQVMAHQRLNEFLDVHGVSVLQGDAAELPVSAEEFSHYVSIGALCHTYDRQRVLDEAFRVLIAGGHLEIVDFIEGPEPAGEYFGGAFWKLISEAEYVEGAGTAGFFEVSSRDLTDDYTRQLELLIEIIKHARGIYEPRFGGADRFDEALDTYRGFLSGLTGRQSRVIWLSARKPSARPALRPAAELRR